MTAQTLTTWDSLVRVTASTTALTKSSGCDGCADAGAHSGTQLTGDGYAEFVVPSLSHVFAGLGADLSAATAPSTINYAFNLQSAGTWEIRELGTYRKDGTYAPGDRFRVAVESGAVVYRRNGVALYTSRIAPAFPLVLDVTIYSMGGSLAQSVVAPAAGGSGGDTGGSGSGGTGSDTGNTGGSGVPTAEGPYRAITDRNAYAKPPLPALGPAGSVINDPVFHTPIRRITDNVTRPGSIDRSYRTPSSPHQNAWSVNSSYFYVMGSGGVGPIPYAFEPSTGMARRMQPAATGDGGLVLKFYIEPQFSYVSDSIIYGSYSGTGSTRHTIDQYDFSTGLYTKLMDLDTIAGGLSGTYIGGVGSSGGPNERIETFFGGTSQDHHHYVLVFDRANPQNRQIIDTWASTINGKAAPITLDFSLHHAMIDRSGRYVMLYATSADQAAPRNAAQEYLWDLQTGTVTEMGGATHPYGHDAFGYGVLVNKDCCSSSSWDAAQWQFRSLAAPLAPRDLIKTMISPKETYLSDHTTWNNARADRLTPVISGLYRFGTTTVAWRPWDDEIIGIQTDAPAGTDPTVWRFAHHRTDVSYDGDPTRTAFWYQPHANVSQDGQWILFTSNWQKTLGIDVAGEAGTGARQDVFMLALQAAAPAIVPVAIATPAVPAGRVSVPYSLALTATGGTGAYVWSADAMPAGLSLNASTGAISGTPSAAGTVAVHVSAADSSNTANCATVTLSFAIAPAPIAVTTTSLPRVRATQAYAATLQASGGSGTVHWTLDTGILPAGVSLDQVTGALAGTATSAGTSSFTVRATDASDPANAASAALSITIDAAPVLVTSASLPAGRATLGYAAVVQAAGGTGAYTWAIASGTLPAGLALDAATGAISGTASAAGTSTFAVRVTDSGDATNTGDAPFTIVIAAPPVTVTTTSLPTGRERIAYASTVLQGAGGGGPIVWSATGVPGGLSLNAATGTIAGTPTLAGTYTVNVSGVDSTDSSNVAVATYTVTVAAAIRISSPRTLPYGTAGVAYAYTIGSSNAIGPTKWNVQGGALPPGMTLDASTGAITGTCRTKGTYWFNARVQDANTSDTLTLTLVIK
jgi:hypothetical protein